MKKFILLSNHQIIYHFIEIISLSLFILIREPIENLECQDLIDEFERKDDKIVEDESINKKQPKRKSTKLTSSNISSTQKRSNEKTKTLSNGTSKTGFDEGLTVDCILGATDAAGELMFLIKWLVLILKYTSNYDGL